MHPNPIQRLIEFFMRLPGIGPRQASRFAYTLLDEDEKTLGELSQAILDLGKLVSRCQECFRSIDRKNGDLCANCASTEIRAILVVEKDQDLETMLKAGVWQDAYHVLGGTISLLNEKSRVTDRIRALYDRVKQRSEKNKLEIVLATSTTTEGDSTALYIERVLEPFIKNGKISLSRLGRGISTGSEIEYSDRETLKDALINRKKSS